MKKTTYSIRMQTGELTRRLCRRTTGAWGLGLAVVISAAQAYAAASYTWNVTSGNWSTPASWTPATTGPAGPLAVDTAIFGVNDTSASANTVNNIVDAGFSGTISNLTYNSTAAAAFHVTQIPSGQTLKVTGAVLVGGVNGAGANVTTEAYMTGGGTLMATGRTFTVQNYNNTSAQGSIAFLNLSNLNYFVYNNNVGTISVEDNSGSNTRLGGSMTLAGISNSITATNINLGTSAAAQAGPAGSFVLGLGTNNINVANLNVANNKCTFTVNNTGGGLRIRGLTGSDSSRANIIVGNRNVASSTGATTGNMLLNGCSVNIMANSLIVGEAPNTAGPTSATGLSGNGVLQFDTGVIDATNLVMAYNTSPNAAGGIAAATSAVTVGANAVLRLGTGGISLLNQTASNSCTSSLTISNGTVICNGNITVATNAAAGTGAASETNSINFIGGGTLVLGSGCVTGTTNSPIGRLMLDTNTSLQFVAPPNNRPAIAAGLLVWPAVDTGVTFVVSNLPSTATVGTTIPLLQFNAITGGTFTAPVAVLPTGVTGSLSLSGTTILLTITSSTYPYFNAVPFTLATLCTNTTISCTVNSLVTTITNVQVIAQTSTLGGIGYTYSTNNIGSANLSVSGLNTASAVITYSLATNTIFNSITFKATDANGITISQSVAQFDNLSPALVIEASDFNFNSGLFIDTPGNGGVALYTNQIGVAGIDENKATRNATRSYYRTNDAVVMQAANPNLGTPPSLTEQKFLDALANGDTVDTEQEVGYNTPGDWVNYSRTFGLGGSAPAGNYNVWCYLATSGTGTQISFSQLTSDPTQGSQTTNFLGTFGNSSFTDNGYNNFVYVPLVDQFGNRVSVTVNSGVQTFKSTVVGNPNIAFYVLMPVAPVLTPQVLHVYPDGSTPAQATNRFAFTVGPAQGAALYTNGIHLVVNGADVSSGLSFSIINGNWTASLPLQSNFVYTAVINVTNTSGLSTSYSISFDTMDMNNYQLEAVDYDYSTNNGTGWVSGQFIDNPVPTGDTNAPYLSVSPVFAPNSYNAFPTGFMPGSDPYGYGAVAIQGIDVNYTNAAGMQSAYRADTYGGIQNSPVVGSSVATDTINGGLRYQFLVSQTNNSDPAICEFNLGWFNASDWVNYTRTYPTGKYNVWSRLAGGVGAFSGTTLGIVTNGVGTSNQLTQVLGSFADASPSGWQTYHWIPLLDTNGNHVVVSLAGKATLKLTSGGNLNPLFFMLTPVITASAFSISAIPSGGSVQISVPTQFGLNYTIWQSSGVQPASWTQVGSTFPGDGTVHLISQPATSDQMYYRASAQ